MLWKDLLRDISNCWLLKSVALLCIDILPKQEPWKTYQELAGHMILPSLGHLIYAHILLIKAAN